MENDVLDRTATKEEFEDYIKDTALHINRVQVYMNRATNRLVEQLILHDQSKYSNQEADIYAKVTPEFAKYSYGTPEHSAVGDKLGPAWEHHVKNNPHHPQHHDKGVYDMDLLYVIEMLCDWKAASLRDPNQDFLKSLNYNMDKYHIDSPLMRKVMINTAKRLGMLDKDER